MPTDQQTVTVNHWTDLGTGDGPRGFLDVTIAVGKMKANATAIVQLRPGLSWAAASAARGSTELHADTDTGIFIYVEDGVLSFQSPPFDGGVYIDSALSLEVPVEYCTEAFAEFDNRMRLWEACPVAIRGNARTWAELMALSPWSEPELEKIIAETRT